MAETESEATLLLEAGYPEAEAVIEDPDKMERLLQRLEEKLKMVPLAGGPISNIPVLVAMIRSYANKDYPDIPLGSLIAIISALLYFLSPIDLIPDAIPGIGYLDDAAVTIACLKMVQSDVDEYKAWREKQR